MYARIIFVLVVLGVAGAGSVVDAQFQMPDAKEMSGIPRPVTDLPNGTVNVRLIRGDLSNNIPNHPVELHVGGKVLTVNTDDTGRAQFSDLDARAAVKAIAVVDGERLESQEFPVPTQGGVRMLLVATDKNKAPATTPDAAPVAGQVVIGNQSRIVIEPGDETVSVYYLLDIDNTARVPVNPPAPFVFEMPKGARGTAIMDGSSPLASVEGSRVTVKAPFPPGHTFVQVAAAFDGGSGALNLTQTFPASFQQLAVVVRKVGATTFSSPQAASQREMPADGETLIVATGGAVAAGQPIALSISGFPHHSNAPRMITLMLAGLIVAIGVWAGGRTTTDAAERAAERKRLIARREKLFGDLVKLEHDRRNGRADERRYSSRRAELIAALEAVYSALDDSEPVAA
jgi:hypothetical protein